MEIERFIVFDKKFDFDILDVFGIYDGLKKSKCFILIEGVFF